jgi:hypothetical protein
MLLEKMVAINKGKIEDRDKAYNEDRNYPMKSYVKNIGL